MKIRTGFVSNSSSTSYVIAVTRDFISLMTEERKQEFMKEWNYWADKKVETIEQLEEKIKIVLDFLCEGDGRVWTGDGEIPEGLYAIGHGLKEVLIAATDLGPADGDWWTNILADDVKEKSLEQMKLLSEIPNENT